MEDLLQTQIRDSCKLALPSGLQDLMSDISREVLRAQPQNLYQFIAAYLSALMVARENLSVAARVCDDVCNAECWPELEDELRSIGFSDEDVETAGKVIMEFIQGDQVEERNLLLRLVKKTDIKEHQFPAVLKAVRRAYLAHKRNTEGSYHSSSGGSDMDETTRAARHTLRLYRKTIRSDEDYSRAAEIIQAEQVIQDPDFLPLDRCSSTATSFSLAGSFVALPPFAPYGNTYSDIVELEEEYYDRNEEIKKPRKRSVNYESENSPNAVKVVNEQIFEKLINDENLYEEVIHEEIIAEDENVFNDTINESTKHDVSDVSYEDEEITEKLVSMKDDEISDGSEAEFTIEIENEDDDDEDGKSCDLYSNKEFDYESSKETYSD